MSERIWLLTVWNAFSIGLDRAMKNITAAMTNAKVIGANPTLAALAGDPAVGAAIGRLAKWDFSTPTGIAAGYDASDVNGVLSQPAQAEIDNSVAATIYSAWRSRFLPVVGNVKSEI